MDTETASRCGFVAIVGRPNVGKSTLMNQLLGRKISITSDKAQTTRHRICGIKTIANTQIIYIDTPGLHQNEVKALNRYMNKTVKQVLREVDLVVMLVEGDRWTEEDQAMLQSLAHSQLPVILGINKVDLMKEKERLLPLIEQLRQKREFTAIIPLSASKGINTQEFEKTIASLLPEDVHFFSAEQYTDRSERFFAAEIIREKLLRHLGQEVPYSATVEIEEFKQEQKLLRIHAMILVEREGQKAIIIGKNGERLKQIATNARIDLERFFKGKVYLNLWVKVKRGWADDARALKSLGYDDN